MKQISPYLSTLAARVFPGAVAWCVDEGREGEHWQLERVGMEPVVLGRCFHDARWAVQVLNNAERERVRAAQAGRG